MVPKDIKFYIENTDGLKLCGILTAPRTAIKKCVVLCHGITVDKKEDGNFIPLTKRLNQLGYPVFRFDFRGHGESEGDLEYMTISGEIDDLSACISFLERKGYINFAIVGASFGAVSTINYCESHDNISCLVLWYPVLDLKKTFLSPELPWAKKSFNKKGFMHLKRKGYLLHDNQYKIGKDLIKEMDHYKPYSVLQSLTIPVLTLHGDKDTYVSYNLSKKYGKPNKKSQFLKLRGAEHGFGRTKELAFAVNQTGLWIRKHLN